MSKRKSLRIGGTIVHLMLAAAWLSFYDCGTAAADYSFELDRFEISGQVSESDEFDNDVVDPWVIHDPTVEESGGFVSFSSPGTIEGGVLDGFSYLAEMSFIGSGYPSPFDVENGKGDFTGISRWDNIVPGVNQWYEMHVGYELQQDPHVGINIGVCVANWDSEFAGIMGIDPGLGISFHGRREGNFVWQHILISEDDLTNANAILLKLDFYDDDDEFRAGFSMDGGANYQYFPELIGWDRDTPGHYEWYFGGESIELQASPVAIDIKPGSCPNPLNVNSKGVLPVAILGTGGFDVTQVDGALLEGVAPIKFDYEDVSTLVRADTEECECTTEGPDGYLDLTLKFDTQEIVTAIGDVEDGQVLHLTLEVILADETILETSDCVVILKKGEDE